MKGVIVLSVLVALATSSSLPAPIGASDGVPNYSEDLDEFTATTLETFGFLIDELDDDDDDDDDVPLLIDEDDDNSSLENQVLHANMTDDGSIEIEDMIVSPDMFQVLFPHVVGHPANQGRQSIHRRAGMSSKSRLWPKGRIPYTYSSKLDGSHSKIRSAMNEWEKYTCIKFEYKKSSDKRFVQIRTKTDSRGTTIPGCSSALGYTRRVQYINLSKNCFAHRTILHELGHTIGLIHEHQHPEREKYVTIVWDNINPTKKSNFKTKTGVSSYGYAYDPTSIMHYRSSSFKKSGCKSPCYTIVSKKGSSTTRLMGTAGHLSSKSDIPVVRKMYSCTTSG